MASPMQAARSKQEVQCPICLDEFDLVESRASIRVLPCNDMVCHECIIGLIRTNQREVKCPRCQKVHGLHDPTGRLSTEQLAQKMPTAEEYAKSLDRNESLMRLTALSSKSICSDPGCASEAAFFCSACGLQCEECSSVSHPKDSTHVRLSLADQRAAKHKTLASAAARLTANSSEHGAAVDRALKGMREAIDESKARFTADIAHADATDADIDALIRVANQWKTQSALRRRRANQRHADLESEGVKFIRRLESRRSEADRLSGMSAESILALPESEVRSAFDADKASEIRDDFGWWLQRLSDVPPRVDRHPAAAILRQVNAPSLLPSLPTRLQSQMQAFFDGTGKSLANVSLLYRASRDGWMPEDFFRCCSEKGPTLTMIKAAGSGFVFGAYTAVSWPKPGTTDDVVVVPDTSGTSFLFSLTNKYRRPFRLSLVDHSCAISVKASLGPVFGATVKDGRGKPLQLPLLLMMNKSAADTENNFVLHDPDVSECAYQLDTWPDHPPNGFKLDSATFAGKKFFAAAEIEVYTLDADPDSASAADIDEEVSISPFSCAPAASLVEHSQSTPGLLLSALAPVVAPGTIRSHLIEFASVFAVAVATRHRLLGPEFGILLLLMLALLKPVIAFFPPGWR